MKFTKMHGAGNDFILINNMEEGIAEADMGSLAARLCSRRYSVGADGVMFVDAPQQDGDYRMLFFNADGSRGEMCGNGARCIARYGYEKGLAGETQRIETTAGLVIGRRMDADMYEVRLNDPSVLKPEERVLVDGKQYVCGYAELGNPGIPHAVILLDDWENLPKTILRELGRLLRYHTDFPKGANVSFVRQTGENEVKAITYERGVEDFTEACGTGCGSIVSVMTMRGLVSGQNTRVRMPGGELSVSLTRNGDTVEDIYLTGPTCLVCEGELY